MSNPTKSPFLKVIRKAFVLSEMSKEPNAPELNELIEQVDMVREEYSRRKFVSQASQAALYLGLASMLPGCRKEVLPDKRRQRDGTT